MERLQSNKEIDYRKAYPQTVLELKKTVIRLYKKGRLFCDTMDGVTATAVYYSIINAAKANKLDTYWHMCYLLDKLPKLKCKKDFIPFIPQNVKKEDIQKFKEESIKNSTI